MLRGLPKFEDPNLLVGAEGFSDAGVYRLRDDLLIVQSVDFFPPLVDDPHLFGRIAATNALGDLYAMGARPTTALNIVGFPDDQLELSILGEILRGGAEQVRAAGAVVVGGHSVRDTEIKFGLSVTGVVKPEELMTNRDARPGERLVLTKPLGTGFVTTAFKAGRCPPPLLEAACASMTQLNRIGSEAARAVGVRGATDITGFGLAGHALEMAEASGVTLRLELDRLPLLPGVEELVRRGNRTRASVSNRAFVEPNMQLRGTADPIRLEILFDAQTSGGLLLSAPADRADELVERIQAGGGRSACVIGEVMERGEYALLVEA